jgi:exopolyphosphatase/guanosine-5'-triphosphate,3'-diphosphate pyrophosphatase
VVVARPVRAARMSAAAGPPVRVAAIDCGTNSLRLLVADVDPVRRTLSDLERRMEIVRLGQGVDATGRLAPDALDRTFGVLAEYAAIIKASSVGAVRMVATSATRDAANAAEFTAGVTRILGTAPEVLTGGQEAALSFAGATAELAGQAAGEDEIAAPYLVTDIGGGSTEFVIGGGPGVGGGPGAGGSAGGPGTAGDGDAGELAACSVDIGCVRLTERHLHSDPPTSAEITAATADIDAAVHRAAAAVSAGRARTLVGLAGSVTTVAGIALDLPAYDPSRIHHARIPAGQVHEVSSMLLGMTTAQRRGIGVMHPGRADVIGAGALVLDRIVTLLGFAEVVVSEHDILDGIAWSLADRRAG